MWFGRPGWRWGGWRSGRLFEGLGRGGLSMQVAVFEAQRSGGSSAATCQSLLYSMLQTNFVQSSAIFLSPDLPYLTSTLVS